MNIFTNHYYFFSLEEVYAFLLGGVFFGTLAYICKMREITLKNKIINNLIEDNVSIIKNTENIENIKNTENKVSICSDEIQEVEQTIIPLKQNILINKIKLISLAIFSLILLTFGETIPGIFSLLTIASIVFLPQSMILSLNKLKKIF
jgi:hypothetical protein